MVKSIVLSFYRNNNSSLIHECEGWGPLPVLGQKPVIVTLVLLAQVDPSNGFYGYYSPSTMITYLPTENLHKTKLTTPATLWPKYFP